MKLIQPVLEGSPLNTGSASRCGIGKIVPNTGPMTTSHLLQDCPYRVKPSGRTSSQMVSTYRSGPTVRRQSRYAKDSGVHPTSGIDSLEKVNEKTSVPITIAFTCHGDLIH
jgi:hypothetical protein